MSFTITNANPNAPTGLAIVGGTPTNDTTPSFTATFSDNDTNDQPSQQRLHIRLQSGGGDVYDSGWVAWTNPALGHTVGSALVYDAFRLYWATRDQDAAESAEATLDFEVTAVPAGTPGVTITAPTAGATVTGDVTITASLTDDVGVAEYTIAVDGVVIDSGTVDPVDPALDISTIWDSITWANGLAQITVTVSDGVLTNSTTILVTVQNLQPITDEVLFTTLFDLTAQLGTRLLTNAGMNLLTYDTSGGNPAAQRRLWVGSHAGAESVDVTEYTNCPEKDQGAIDGDANGGRVRYFQAVFTGATQFQFCVRSRPVQPEPSYSLSASIDLMRLIERTADVLVLALTPDKVFSFDGVSTLTQLADLAGAVPGEDPVDMAWYAPTLDPNGKIVVAYPSQVRLYDPDIGDLAQVILPPTGNVTSIATLGQTLYIGTDAGTLYSFTYPAFRLIDTVEAITVLRVVGSLLGIGCAGGNIYTYTTGTPALAYATGQATVNAFVSLTGGPTYVATGASGKIYHSTPTWAEEVDLTLATIKALATYRDADGAEQIYAGGTGTALYRRESLGSLSNAVNLECTSINDMLTLTDSNGDDYLLIATSGSVDARLYRFDVVAAESGESGEFIATHFTGIPVGIVQGR